jgi:hypothetical protein
MGLSRGPERSWQRAAVCSGVWRCVPRQACVITTSRDIWTIVETPLAHARGYRQSKTQMKLGSLGGGASLSSFPLRRILLSLRCPLRLFAPRFSLHADPFAPQRRHRNAERTQLRRCFIPTSRDTWTIIETPLAHARGYRQSKNQMTLGSVGGGLRFPRFLCGGCSRLCGALSDYSLHAFRSTPIHLHRRDDTGTQREPCCVAVLYPRLVVFGRSSKHRSLTLVAIGSQKLK